MLWTSYANTIYLTVVGTVINVFTTVLFAYPLARKDFIGRKFFMILMTFTMFFSGGLIPLFILINDLGIYNTHWAILLPLGISTWNVIMTRTFMQNLPISLQESAMLDGANDLRILFNVILPLSTPMIAVIALFSAVNFWNIYFLPMIMTPDPNLQPLQVFLMNVVIMHSPEGLGATMGFERILAAAQLRHSVIMVVVLPIIFFYPFLQKYFIKGVMIGALKG